MKTAAIFLLVLAAFMLGQYLDQDLMPQQQKEAK
jgi:ABC-type dipeptide/oligopeptide/nickel transport system permease subunit